MNLSSLNPADRAKAAGMVVAIVLVLVFVAHTVLGAMRPKTAANAVGANATAATAAVPGPPVPPVADVPPTPAGAAFPLNAKETATTAPTGGGLVNLDVHDPFVPLNPDAKKGPGAPAAPVKTAAAKAPDVTLGPPSPGGSLPALGSRPVSAGEPLVGPGPMGPAIVAPPVEPVIRLLGVITGEQSVATIEVSGRVLLARPGERLAKGYRLAGISADGVLVRHLSDAQVLRVGQSMNDLDGSKK